MLTRQGVVIVAAAVTVALVGRVFGVVELFVIAAALLAAVAFALVYVTIRRPRVSARRWIHPRVLAAGDTGRVDIHVEHLGTVPSAGFIVCEIVRRVGTAPHEAQLDVAPMAPRSRHVTGYRVPTSVRGVIEFGPLTLEVRDPLGIARASRGLAAIDQVVVVPRTLPIEMPLLGHGTLGAALLQRAHRLGPGDFHGLREYAPGDELRSIHWRASARTDTLLVRQHSVEGLHRCTVVLDVSRSGYATASGFEQAITAAASLVTAAARANLNTRFTTTDGIDLRGPDVAAHTLRVLAQAVPTDSDGTTAIRAAGDGLGMVVVISASRAGSVWNTAADPASSLVAVTTEQATSGGLVVPARSDDEFVRSWAALTGRIGAAS